MGSEDDEGLNASRQDTVRRFGRAIKNLRQISGDSGPAIAAKAGFSRVPTYYDIENENAEPPRLDVVLRIMQALGIEPDLFWMLLESPAVKPRKGVPPEMERRLALAQELSDRAAAMVRELRREPPEQP